MTHQANHADFFTLPDNLDHPEHDDDMLSDEDTEEDRGGAGIDDVD